MPCTSSVSSGVARRLPCDVSQAARIGSSGFESFSSTLRPVTGRFHCVRSVSDCPLDGAFTGRPGGGCMKVGPTSSAPSSGLPGLGRGRQGGARPGSTCKTSGGTLWRRCGPAGARLLRGEPAVAGGRAAVIEARAQLGIAVGQFFPVPGRLRRHTPSPRKATLAPPGPSPAPASPYRTPSGRNTMGLSASWEIEFWGKYDALSNRRRDLRASAPTTTTPWSAWRRRGKTTGMRINRPDRYRPPERGAANRGLKSPRPASVRRTSERRRGAGQNPCAVHEATIPGRERNRQEPYSPCPCCWHAPGYAPEGLGETVGFRPRLGDRGGRAGRPAGAGPTCAQRVRGHGQCAKIGGPRRSVPLDLARRLGGLPGQRVGVFSLSNLLSQQGFTAQFVAAVHLEPVQLRRDLDNVRVQDAKFKSLLIQSADGARPFAGGGRLAAYIGAAPRWFRSKRRPTRPSARPTGLHPVQRRQDDYTTVLVAAPMPQAQDDLVATLGTVAPPVSLYRALGGAGRCARAALRGRRVRRRWKNGRGGARIREKPANGRGSAKAACRATCPTCRTVIPYGNRAARAARGKQMGRFANEHEPHTDRLALSPWSLCGKPFRPWGLRRQRLRAAARQGQGGQAGKTRPSRNTAIYRQTPSRQLGRSARRIEGFLGQKATWTARTSKKGQCSSSSRPGTLRGQAAGGKAAILSQQAGLLTQAEIEYVRAK